MGGDAESIRVGLNDGFEVGVCSLNVVEAELGVLCDSECIDGVEVLKLSNAQFVNVVTIELRKNERSRC